MGERWGVRGSEQGVIWGVSNHCSFNQDFKKNIVAIINNCSMKVVIALEDFLAEQNKRKKKLYL